MDIQTTKLQLVQKILDTNEKQVLEGVQQLLDQSSNVDFWNRLDTKDQEAIQEGVDQLEKGQYYTGDEAKKEIKRRLNWK